jgi:Protein of unknown function (DUF3293)
MEAWSVMNPAYFRARFRVTTRQVPWPGRFAVITAWNPMGRPADPAANSRAATAFQDWLAASGLPFFQADGGSPDFAHVEPGFGIELPDWESGVRLGRALHQEAIYWIEGGDLFLVQCSDPEPVLIAQWEDRLHICDEGSRRPDATAPAGFTRPGGA